MTLALLLVAFGALVAALLPVLTGALAVGLALGIVSLLATAWPLSILAVNVISMLGLALGIDYALLTVSRFREARAAGEAAADGGRSRRLAMRGGRSCSPEPPSPSASWPCSSCP